VRIFEAPELCKANNVYHSTTCAVGKVIHISVAMFFNPKANNFKGKNPHTTPTSPPPLFYSSDFKTSPYPVDKNRFSRKMTEIPRVGSGEYRIGSATGSRPWKDWKNWRNFPQTKFYTVTTTTAEVSLRCHRIDLILIRIDNWKILISDRLFPEKGGKMCGCELSASDLFFVLHRRAGSVKGLLSSQFLTFGVTIAIFHRCHHCHCCHVVFTIDMRNFPVVFVSFALFGTILRVVFY
jgi:hypothetical protein